MQGTGGARGGPHDQREGLRAGARPQSHLIIIFFFFDQRIAQGTLHSPVLGILGVTGAANHESMTLESLTQPNVVVMMIDAVSRAQFVRGSTDSFSSLTEELPFNFFGRWWVVVYTTTCSYAQDAPVLPDPEQ